MLKRAGDGHRRLKAPTGESVDFPTNTSDALMSGGTDAIAGAVERMHASCRRTGEKPALIMTGGAVPKLAPSSTCRSRRSTR
jgi:type III pantothenate kinase